LNFVFSVLTLPDNLALLYKAQGHSEEAEPLYQRSLTIKEKALPPDHLDTTTLENYASLFREMNRPQEAQPLEQHAKAIRAKLSSKRNR
jgi:tetratricopeptide (TPR) repeat protein